MTDKYDQWYDYLVSVSKVTISIESELLRKVDYLVHERVFSSRSNAIQAAVADKLSSVDRLARECEKLDRQEEQNLADLGLAADLNEWPQY